MRLKKLTACILAGAMAISVALTGCGTSIDANAVGATLDGKEISLGFMNFMARYQQAIADASYLYYFGVEMWTQESDGITMEDSTKESIASNIQLLYLLDAHTEEYGVELTEDELAAIDEAAKEFMEDNSEKAIKHLGATEEYVKEMLRLYTIQEKMEEAIGEVVEITVTEEDAAQRTFSYIRVEGVTEEDAEEDEEAQTPEEQLEAVKALAEAAKEDFDAAGEEYEDAATGTYSYKFEDKEDGLFEEVISAADALKEGEVSDLVTVETESDGEKKIKYYILRLDSEYDEEATATEYERLVNAEKSEYYTSICEEYTEASDFKINEKEWAKVKFNRFFSVVTEE